MPYIDGQKIAQAINEKTRKLVQKANSSGFPPLLATVLIGDNQESLHYIQKKESAAKELGIGFKLHRLAQSVGQKELLALIEKLNHDQSVTGIIVQLPLPTTINFEKVIWAIHPAKDVDGWQMRFHRPPTAEAILEIILNAKSLISSRSGGNEKYLATDLRGQRICIIGQGKLVGKPLEILLKKQGLSPMMCDENTQNINEAIKSADIVVVGVGKPGLVTKEMLRPGQIVVDAGFAVKEGKVFGDVARSALVPNVYLTPVPGGVGPVTVALVLQNTVRAALLLWQERNQIR